ncbi:MAG: diguanylate cyclase [Roseinatronobacter sp.]|nr:MAG: diguanylate cyclase [Roseinatronobacter sp.]
MPAQILVVDDLLLSRMILRVKLSAACYTVRQATTGAEALHHVAEHPPALVLLDFNLPDATGLEICRQLRSDPKTSSIPIILFSADQSRSTRLQALAAGADDFLSKPLDDAYLMSRIRALLRTSAVEKDYQARCTPTLRHGLAEAQSQFHHAPRVTLVRSSAILAQSNAGTWPDIAPELFDDARSLSVVLSDSNPVQPPDVLLLGPEILDEQGLHVIAELRARHATCRIPIAVLLDKTTQTSPAMVLDLGAEEALRLPLDAEEVQLRLQVMIKRKRKADAMRQALGVELDLASRDPLTGLFNRRHAMSRLSDIVATPPDGTARNYAILLIDLDNFKRVNDCFGHGAGDEVLIEASARMRDAIGPHNLLARYGGEEFLLLLPDAEMVQACAMAEEIRRQIEGRAYHLTTGNFRLQVTASIGVTVQTSITSEAPLSRLERVRQVVDHADQALHTAKTTGRNRVSVGHCSINPARALAPRRATVGA